MIVFIDESGLKRPCNCLSLGAVAFPRRRGVSYLELGYHLVEGIKTFLKVGGELKWRAVKRRGDPETVISLIRQVAEIKYIAFHYKGPEDVTKGVEILARGASLVVVDNQLLQGAKPAVYYLERDSRRVPGLQLADVVAGYAREKLCGG